MWIRIIYPRWSKKCYMNLCQESSWSSHLCKTCDEDYYPDDNSGCVLTKNCEVSENGNCKICIENYALIYSGKNYIECISMDEEELLYREE